MKKLLALPVIWLVLGMIAIATQIKADDLLPTGQQYSSTVIACIKDTIDKKDTVLISAATAYQNWYITALIARKTAILIAWDKPTKKEIKSALSTVSKTYDTTIKALKKTLKTSQKRAQSTYKTTIKTCKSTGLWDLIESTNSED